MNSERDQAEILDQYISRILAQNADVPRSKVNNLQNEDQGALVLELRKVAESTHVRPDFISELETRLLGESPAVSPIRTASVTDNHTPANYKVGDGSKGWWSRWWSARHSAQQAAQGQHVSGGMGQRVSRELGLAGALVVLLGLIGGAFLFVKQQPAATTVQILYKGTPTLDASKTGIDIGGAFMLDPQGDRDLAKLVLSQASSNGAPQVILSRKVLGGELPCLGYGGSTNIEMRPTDMFGLVVLHGELRQNFLGGNPFPVPYMAYVYDLKYKGITATGGPYWRTLRGSFGSSGWPQDSPMYLSPDGQPSLAELGEAPLPRGYSAQQAQDIYVSQSISGWTVTVARVYAQGSWVALQYTVVGPGSHTRFSVDQPLIKVGGKELSMAGMPGNLVAEGMGPSVDQVGFLGVPEAAQSQDIAMQFVVPAIHVRPGVYPCEISGLKAEQYPTPTRIPDDMTPGGYNVTPAPDVQTVGPFTFDLNVHVEPQPTQPVVPTSVPTIDWALPYPTATGEPERQYFTIAMGNDGAGIPAIEPRGTPTGTDTGTSRITKEDVEQYVSTHKMQGMHITISYEGSEPTISGINSMPLRGVYELYAPDVLQHDWQGTYPLETKVWVVELHGTFLFSGGPTPGNLGTYRTGVWVFTANTGYDILEMGVGRIPAPAATIATTAVATVGTAPTITTPTRVPDSPPVALVREGNAYRLDVYEGAAQFGSPSWIGPSRLLVGWSSVSSIGAYSAATYILDASSGTLTSLPKSLTEGESEVVSSPDNQRAVMIWQGSELHVALYDFRSGSLETVLDLDPSVPQWAGSDIDLSGFRPGAEIFVGASAVWAGNDNVALTLILDTSVTGFPGPLQRGKVLLVNVAVRSVRVLDEQSIVAATFSDGSLLLRPGWLDGEVQLIQLGDKSRSTVAPSGPWSVAWSPSPDGNKVAWLEMSSPTGDWSHQLPNECCSGDPAPAVKNIAVFDRATGNTKRFEISNFAWSTPDITWAQGEVLTWSNDSSALFYATHPAQNRTSLYRVTIDGQVTALAEMETRVGFDVVAESREGSDSSGGSIYYRINGKDCQNCVQLVRLYADGKTELVRLNGVPVDWQVDGHGRLEVIKGGGIEVTDLSTGQSYQLDFPGVQITSAELSWRGVSGLVPISPDGTWAAYAGRQNSSIPINPKDPNGPSDRGSTVRIVPVK